MPERPTYEELAAAIARYVRANLYWEEKRSDGSSEWLFDNMCESQRQIPAGVLLKLGMLRSLDPLDRRCVFTCEPDQYAEMARKNKCVGCSYDAVVSALIALAEAFAVDDAIAEYLVDLELLDPEPERLSDRRQAGVMVGSGAYSPPEQVVLTNGSPSRRYVWTRRKDDFDRILDNWTSMFD